MNELVAIQDIDEMDGRFAPGDRFSVTDERALILTRAGKAKRVGDPTLADDLARLAVDAAAGKASKPAFNVPRSAEAA